MPNVVFVNKEKGKFWKFIVNMIRKVAASFMHEVSYPPVFRNGYKSKKIGLYTKKNKKLPRSKKRMIRESRRLNRK